MTDDISVRDSTIKLVDKWYSTKQEIAKLEKKCDDYKEVLDRLMVKLDTDRLEGSDMCLKKTRVTKALLTKKDVPPEVWDKYATTTTYTTYTFSKRK